MWLIHLFGMLMVVAASRENYYYEKIGFVKPKRHSEMYDGHKVPGYFWHITDVHYDPHHSNYLGDLKKGSWRPDYEGGGGNCRPQRRSMSRYGDYSCDASWELIESAARAMMSRQNDNVEFVLWTGDALSHSIRRHDINYQLKLIQNLTDLLGKTFSSQFVFPALGHDDPSSVDARNHLGRMWSRWLPTDSMKTFETGGYYMIESKTLKLQIIVLNTNLMRNDENDEEARNQWNWLEGVLRKCMQHGKTVYLVGHMPPGSDERQRGTYPTSHAAHSTYYTDYHNRRYLSLVRTYEKIIVGQFFGHLHSDTFRVIYNDHGRPASWVMLAPAITPRRPSDRPNNPGLRLYKFDKDTGQVLDYTQYYLDLSVANSNGKIETEWSVEYNFSSYYGISNITPLSLHNLAEKLNLHNPNPTFNRYYRAYSVGIGGSHGNCDANCAHTHYCAITRVDYQEHEHCLKTAASALSASSASLIQAPIYSLFIINFVICKV